MSSPVKPPSREVGVDGGRGPHISADADPPGRPARVPPNPASVKINVEGAFIVDDEINGKNGAGVDGVHYEHKDIRLPHHTAVVSHVAVDVSATPLL
jgi:type II pantothenate kinase